MLLSTAKTKNYLKQARIFSKNFWQILKKGVPLRPKIYLIIRQ